MSREIQGALDSLSGLPWRTELLFPQQVRRAAQRGVEYPVAGRFPPPRHASHLDATIDHLGRGPPGTKFVESGLENPKASVLEAPPLPSSPPRKQVESICGAVKRLIATMCEGGPRSSAAIHCFHAANGLKVAVPLLGLGRSQRALHNGAAPDKLAKPLDESVQR